MANTVDIDVVESLRFVAQSAKPVDAGQMRAAADEIERLRRWTTLTDEEREAIQRGIDQLSGIDDASATATMLDDAAAATLRGLLERTNPASTPQVPRK